MDTELITKIDKFFKDEFEYSIKHEEVEVYVIGSFADQTYDKESDLDMLVTGFPDKSAVLTGEVYSDKIKYESAWRDVHICVNYETGFTESKPFLKVQYS